MINKDDFEKAWKEDPDEIRTGHIYAYANYTYNKSHGLPDNVITMLPRKEDIDDFDEGICCYGIEEDIIITDHSGDAFLSMWELATDRYDVKGIVKVTDKNGKDYIGIELVRM